MRAGPRQPSKQLSKSRCDEVAVDAVLRDLARRQLGGVGVPAVRELDVHAGCARASTKYGCQPRPTGCVDRRRRWLSCSRALERRGVEREVLARVESERPVGVAGVAQLEHDLERARGDDRHGRCQPTPCSECGESSKFGARRVVAAAPAKAPVAEPVRVRHERKHRRRARRRQRAGSVERRIGVSRCQRPAIAPPRSGRNGEAQARRRAARSGQRAAVRLGRDGGAWLARRSCQIGLQVVRAGDRVEVVRRDLLEAERSRTARAPPPCRRACRAASPNSRRGAPRRAAPAARMRPRPKRRKAGRT